MSRSKKTGSTQKAGSGTGSSKRHWSGKSANTPTRKGREREAALDFDVGVKKPALTPVFDAYVKTAGIDRTFTVRVTTSLPDPLAPAHMPARHSWGATLWIDGEPRTIGTSIASEAQALAYALEDLPVLLGLPVPEPLSDYDGY